MRFHRPGLRARVTSGFAIGALMVSAAVAFFSYQLTESYLLREREASAIRAAVLEAGIVQAGLSGYEPDVAAVLRSLDTGAHRRAVIFRNGVWYSRNVNFSVKQAIPAALQQLLHTGQPGAQRIMTDTGPAIVVGIPLADSTSFYVVDYLTELDRSLRILGVVMTLVAAATTAGGAALGAYASRYVVRPLTSVVKAARTIRAGDYTTRLDPAAEPDLARLANTFNAMVDELSARMEADRRFAADVSHELRSPLQTMSAAASVLTRHQDGMNPRAAAAAQLMTSETKRFEELVAALLELAKSDQPAQRESVDIAALAKALCDSRNLVDAHITVAPGSDPMWHADPRRFRQILANLIDNAVAHGGALHSVHIGSTATDWFLHVDDQGPGVNPPDRAVIFGRFVRGRPTNRSEATGAGLGLALVYQHALAHGGTVTAGDRPGGGARFTVQIPRDRK